MSNTAMSNTAMSNTAMSNTVHWCRRVAELYRKRDRQIVCFEYRQCKPRGICEIIFRASNKGLLSYDERRFIAGRIAALPHVYKHDPYSKFRNDDAGFDDRATWLEQLAIEVEQSSANRITSNSQPQTSSSLTMEPVA